MIIEREFLAAYCWFYNYWGRLVIWNAALVVVVWQAFLRFNHAYRTKWFRPAQWTWSDKYTWEDIRQIMGNDPLDEEGIVSFRGIDRWSLPRDVIKVVIVVVALYVFWLYLFCSYFPSQFYYDVTPLIGPLWIKIFGALVGLGGVLYKASIELRAKVRSDNRQKWINDVRDTLSDVINEIPLHQPAAQAMIRPSLANRARIRLELLLNPSERDHRTLGVLLRTAYNIPLIDIDRPVLAHVGADILDPWILNLPLPDSNRRRDQLITQIVRVSNAMLKREWELVKYGR